MKRRPRLYKNETIKDVLGYEGLYSITSRGRVWSWGNGKNIRANWLKAQKGIKGYLYVGLHKNGKLKRFRVHRLVAITFIPNAENKPCVNHKDFNVENNSVENLEWCTNKENTMYSVSRGRWETMVKNKTWEKGAKIANEKETWKKAVKIAKEKEAWKKGNKRAIELKTYKIAQKFAKEANKKKSELFYKNVFVGVFPSIKEAAEYAANKGWASFSTLRAFKYSRDCFIQENL